MSLRYYDTDTLENEIKNRKKKSEKKINVVHNIFRKFTTKNIRYEQGDDIRYHAYTFTVEIMNDTEDEDEAVLRIGQPTVGMFGIIRTEEAIIGFRDMLSEVIKEIAIVKRSRSIAKEESSSIKGEN